MGMVAECAYAPKREAIQSQFQPLVRIRIPAPAGTIIITAPIIRISAIATTMPMPSAAAKAAAMEVRDCVFAPKWNPSQSHPNTLKLR